MNDNEFGRCRFLQEWNDWEKSIHEHEEQIRRQGYSMTYPFTFKICPKERSGTFSSTTDIPYYKTTLLTCNCYDYQNRQLPCKHIYRLAVELGIIEIFNRPSLNKERLAEVKASSDIDNHPDQLKRIESSKSAKCKPVSVDYENKSAVFSGSGLTPYQTTVNTCTCRDYSVRRLPCKHIYRLRDELIKSNIAFDVCAENVIVSSNRASVQKGENSRPKDTTSEETTITKENSKNELENMTFVITGTFNEFDRFQIAEMVEKAGGMIAGSVSGKTNYLISGEDPSESKFNRAQELSVPIISFNDFLEMIK